MSDIPAILDTIAKHVAAREAELKAQRDRRVAELIPTQEELATMSEEQRMDRAREILRAKGLGHLAGKRADRTHPVIERSIHRPMQMAAVYLLGASLSQVAMLFGVSRGSARDATLKHLSIDDKITRPRTQSKPLISNETASLYFNKMQEIGPMNSAHDLAWAVQDSMTAGERDAASDRLDP